MSVWYKRKRITLISKIYTTRQEKKVKSKNDSLKRVGHKKSTSQPASQPTSLEAIQRALLLLLAHPIHLLLQMCPRGLGLAPRIPLLLHLLHALAGRLALGS